MITQANPFDYYLHNSYIHNPSPGWTEQTNEKGGSPPVPILYRGL